MQKGALTGKIETGTISAGDSLLFLPSNTKILVRSIERAERVDEAMRCRGFSGRFPMRRVRPMTFADARFAALAFVPDAGLYLAGAYGASTDVEGSQLTSTDVSAFWLRRSIED